jgi:lipoprotein-anchoring transpeptidase ErfK/SrfK
MKKSNVLGHGIVAAAGGLGFSWRAAGALAAGAVMMLSPFVMAGPVNAQALGYASAPSNAFPSDTMMVSPADAAPTDDGEAGVLPERLRRTVVALDTREAPGTIIIDTGNTALYFVLGQGRAVRYGVGVGREGFTWAGTQTITRKAEWPDWYPPAEMIARQPYLPRFMAGGPGNPLGARAMYLGNSEYRIHGTNDPTTIGKFVSSGCVRLTNEDVADLFSRVDIGSKVVVLPKNAPHLVARPAAPELSSIPAITAHPGRVASNMTREPIKLSTTSID